MAGRKKKSKTAKLTSTFLEVKSNYKTSKWFENF